MPAAEQTAQAQYLVFGVAGESYAVAILRAREIVGYEGLTRLPSAAPWLRGVMSLRGKPVPVVDLALKLGLPATPVTPRTCIVLLELDGRSSLAGVLADGVEQVVELSPESIEAPPALGRRGGVDHLAGMAKLADRFVLILDVDQALSPGEIREATAATADA